MTPEFRNHEAFVSTSEKAYEAFLAAVRQRLGIDFDYGTELEGITFDFWDVDATVADTVAEIRLTQQR